MVRVPKLDPGMPKDAPPTSYRVTMDALVNNCLKPVASTLPLATDEIKKLHGKRFFFKLDAMHAFWAIPLDEESKSETNGLPDSRGSLRLEQTNHGMLSRKSNPTNGISQCRG